MPDERGESQGITARGGGDDSRQRSRRIVWGIVLPCLIGLLWLGLRAGNFGTPTALLAIGPDHPSYPLIHHELPDARTFEGNGYDGMSYYTIARHPFDVHWAGQYLDTPSYRLRRIVFPLAAKALAPSGGVDLIYAFAGLSLLGIAIGGWWLGSFPGARVWLPITLVCNLGVIASLWTSTADVLAAGLTIACFGAAFKRKFGLAIVLLAIAGLTKETSLIAAASLAIWPGLTWKRRVVHLVAPVVPLVLWSLYLSAALGEALFIQNNPGNFSLPFLGWVRAVTPAPQLLLAGLLVVVSVLGLVKCWRRCKPVALYLAVTLAIFICFSAINTNGWWGFARETTVSFPLALWAFTAPKAAVDRAMNRRDPPRQPISWSRFRLGSISSGESVDSGVAPMGVAVD